MKKTTLFIVLAAVVFSVSSAASVTSVFSQQKPVFRARIELMQLDVTVLDKNRRPIRGLTAADFTLTEDNKPQKIEGFTAIDVPDREVPGPVWDKTVSPDVTTNEIDNQRIFVIVLDDGHGHPSANDPAGLWGKREMKKTAEQFFDFLGPKDLAAVVFPGASYQLSQNLTMDRARLIKAVRSYPDNDQNMKVLLAPKLSAGGPNVSKYTDQGAEKCRGKKEVLHFFEALVSQLSLLPDRRKAIIYYGSIMPWASQAGDDVCGTFWMWRDLFAKAEQGHVSINPINTAGLNGGGVGYRTVAEHTGGYAVTGTNDFIPGLKQILLENSSYYLLAYQPTNDVQDGTFRRLKITVNRPDAEVIARRSYWAPREPRPDQPAPPPPPPQVKAMAGLLPLGDLNLRATAVPFAIAGSDKAVVALSVGVRQRALATRTPETVEVLIKSFTADGDLKGTETQTIPITVPAARADSEHSRYEVLGRIELPKPGKYELRFSAHSTISDSRGSVYVDVDVPDFKDAKLSLSGVVVNVLPAAGPVAPARGLADLTPIVPNTERTFAKTDVVTTFLRIYQGGNDRLASVTMKVTVRNAEGTEVFAHSEVTEAGKFAQSRGTEFQTRVPLASLQSGDHVLTFEASMGRNVAKRDVRFAVR